MARTRLKFPQGMVELVEATRTRGTILCAGGPAGQNGMTIGWIAVGNIWSRPGMMVMVRPSRHTYRIIEAGDSFTVNVLSKQHQDAVDLFGTKSGRDMDKFAETGLTTDKGLLVDSPYITEAELVVECKIAFKQPMDPSLIAADFVREAYEEGDYHVLYFGEILGIHTP